MGKPRSNVSRNIAPSGTPLIQALPELMPLLRCRVPTAERALELLLELTKSLTQERSLYRALQLVTDTAMELLPGDHASIRVLNHTRTELLSGARSGTGVGKSPVKHEAGRGVAGWIVDHGQVVRLDDAPLDERFIPKPNQGFAIRSMLGVPLWSAGEVVGVLAVTASDAAVYQDKDEMLACLLANCAVPPIEKARLSRLAVTDQHTMTFNQSYLIPGIKNEMDKMHGRGGVLSLLLMDLDHFKEVNDRFGHNAGDAALREFSDRVKKTTRDNDVLVRRGGDEFVLIMPGSGKESAYAVAERIRAVMRENPVDLGAQGHAMITVSIGVATWDGDETPEGLEKRTDDAMYKAKSDGRDRVFSSPKPESDGPQTQREQIEDEGKPE